MDQPTQSGLVAAIQSELAEAAQQSPAAALALTYAARIDSCTHQRVPIEKALRVLRGICWKADDTEEALSALDKIETALSAVTVISDLGPKLLANLDALMITPKANLAALKAAGAPKEQNPMPGLRDAYASMTPKDEVSAARERRYGKP